MVAGDAVQGTVAGGFEGVRDQFAAVAASEPGLGAQLAAYRHGELVVDLWTGPELTGDSLLGVYSASKGAAHLVVALLVQDGVLDLDQPVSHYWPGFAVEGKRDITLRELLAHQAGLVGADTGQTIAGHFAERVRDARGVDLYLGLPATQEPRFLSAQPMLVTPERLAALAATAAGPNSLTGIAFNRNYPGSPEVWELPNLPAVRTGGPASYGGIASARGLARMYAAAISPLDGAAPLLKPDTAATFAQPHAVGYDLVTRDHKAFAVGFHVTSEYYPVLGQGTFGHSGAGGQQAFADPRNGIAYGYSRRRFPFPAAAAPGNDRLIRALYAAPGTSTI